MLPESPEFLFAGEGHLGRYALWIPPYSNSPAVDGVTVHPEVVSSQDLPGSNPYAVCDGLPLAAKGSPRSQGQAFTWSSARSRDGAVRGLRGRYHARLSGVSKFRFWAQSGVPRNVFGI